MKEAVQFVHRNVSPPVNFPSLRLPHPAFVLEERVGSREVDEAVLAHEQALAGAIETGVGGVVPRVNGVLAQDDLVDVFYSGPFLVLYFR